MKLSEKSNWLFLVLAFFPVVFADQVSKFYAKYLFAVVCNSKLAFGVDLSGLVFPVLALVIIFWLILNEKRLDLKTPLTIIFAAGVSNFLDRVFLGCVRDFFRIGFFPTFNLADSIITIAVVFIIMDIFALKKNEA